MGSQKTLPITLGVLAVASGVALMTFDIVLAASIPTTSSPTAVRATTIVASGFESISLTFLLLLLGRQIRYWSVDHIGRPGHRRYNFLVIGSTAVFTAVATITSAVALGMERNSKLGVQTGISSSPKHQLVVGGFIVWGIALLSQVLFIVCMVVVQRREAQQDVQIRPELSEPSSEMKQASPRPETAQESTFIRDNSTELQTPPSSIGRSRADSDPRSSFHSSISHVVRPITSKSKLISSKSQRRPSSVESSIRATSISNDDGFDSWDTSSVDAQSRQAVESLSPTPQRILETIPASPSTSRSPSPGFPLDLVPPKHRSRSRSYSPVNSFRETRSQTASPTPSIHEAHIHPLFRTDSPTPPPPTTPGTIVTAAPGAGQVISNRSSVQSLHRLRSGSMPTSPLIHQDSFESIRGMIERGELLEDPNEVQVERQLTPPIPEWILSGAPPRNSMSGYTRKQTKSLQKVGEMSED